MAIEITGSEPINLPDPVFLLSLYNENIRTGKTRLHDWQVNLQRQYAKERSFKEVIRIALCANNGSGKSQYGVAPCAAWLAMRFPYSRAVITSASGTQLDRQTGIAVKHIAEQVNKLHGQELWKINYRYYTYLPTNSTLEMYATDEAGKAEGYHPHDAAGPDGEFSIFVDEAKSVAEPIFEALMRCNGLTRRMDVSSPGKPAGHFYNIVTSGRWFTMRVKASNCPHLNKDEIREAKELYGENSALFRSMYLAEFTSTDEQVVITYEAVSKQYNFPSSKKIFGRAYAGLDLAAGGDENVLSVWQGNTQIGLECFRFVDTMATVEHLINLFKKYNLEAYAVTADDGGLGRPIIDALVERGYPCKRVLNQSKAINSIAYSNRGAELYFNFANHLPHLVFYGDQTLKNQLASRYYRQSNQGKMLLESKREARAKGHGSPDRADATVLAFVGKPLTFFRDVENGVLNTDGSDKERLVTPAVPSMEEALRSMDARRYKSFGHENVTDTHGTRAEKILTLDSVIASDEQDTQEEVRDFINNLLRRN